MDCYRYIWRETLPVLKLYYYQSVLFFLLGKFDGAKVLEIGSGATVHSIASASRNCRAIVMSDYVEDNLEQLRKWLKDQSSLKQLLDIQAGLEGYGELV